MHTFNLSTKIVDFERELVLFCYYNMVNIGNFSLS